MADNTSTQILRIDTGKAITSVKEFKSYIEDLKGMLLGLTEGTDDYNKVVKELHKAQDKLNDVMQVAKGRNAEAADSYYNINKQLVALRKEYREMSKAEREGKIGEVTLKEIQRLDSALKQMDNDMGQYFREVGNYKGAFSEVFEKALGPLDKMGGVVGSVFRDIKGMIPLIKQANQTAITGLSGVKAAVAATGIGVLVVLVGELVAHWEDVYKWVTGVNKATEDLADTQKKMMDYIDNETKNIGYQLQIRRAQGQTEVQLLEFQQKAVALEYARLKVYKELLQKKYDEMQAHSFFTKLSQGEYMLMSEIKKHIDETDEKMTKLWDDLVGLGVSLKAAKIKEKADELKDMAAKSKDAAAELEKLTEEANKFVDSLKNAQLTDKEKLKKSFDESLATLEAYHDAGVISEEKYREAKILIHQQYNKDKLALDRAEIEKRKQAEIDAQKEIDKQTLNDLKKIFNEIEQKYGDINIGVKFDYKNIESVGLWNQIFGLKGKKAIEEELNKTIKAIQENANKALDQSKEKVAELELSMADLTEGSEAWYAVLQKITEELKKQGKIKEEAKKAEQEATDAATQAEDGEPTKRWEKISSAIQLTTSMIDQYTQYQQFAIQQDVQNGKISEAEAKKRFKTVKAMQYAQTVMATAAGVATALAGLFTTKSGPWDYALAIIQAASIAAGGAIQMATIKKQQLGSLNSGMNTSTPNLSNITNSYTPQMTANVQTNSELENLSNAVANIQPVVSVVDIEDAQNKVKVRDAEANLM